MQLSKFTVSTSITWLISLFLVIIASAFAAKVTEFDFHDYSDPVSNQADGTRWIRATTTTLQFKDANTSTLTLSQIGSAVTASHAAVTVAGAPDYITLAGQVLTLGLIDLSADVSGLLDLANTTGTLAGSSITLSTTNFDNNLTTATTTVQLLAEAVDELTTGLDTSGLTTNTLPKISGGALADSGISDNGTTITALGVEITTNTLEATTITIRAVEQVTSGTSAVPGTTAEVRLVPFNEATIDSSNDPADSVGGTLNIDTDNVITPNMATTGKLNGGISLYYYNVYLEYISDTVAFTGNEWTINFWMKLPAHSDTGSQFVAQIGTTPLDLVVEDGGDGYEISVSYFAGGVSIIVYDDDHSVSQDTDIEGWHMYTLSQNSSGVITLKVDSTAFSGSDTSSSGAVDFTGTLLIPDPSSTYEEFEVVIDDWREYSEVLTPTQIGLLYNSGSGTESTLASLETTPASTTTTIGTVNRTIPPAQYGELDHFSTTQTLTITVEDTWYEFDHFEAGPAQGIDANATSNSLSVLSDGVYFLSGNASISMPVTAKADMGFSKNDTMLTKPIASQYGSGTGDYHTMTIQGIIAFEAGDEIKLEFRNTDDTSDLSIMNASVIIHRIGN